MNNSLNGRSGSPLVLENLFEKLQVQNISLLNMNACLLLWSKDFKKSVGYILLAVRVVVDHNDFCFLLLQDF